MAAAEKISNQNAHQGADKEPAESNAPLDTDALRNALSGTTAEAGPTSPIHTMHAHVESRMAGGEVGFDQALDETWSVRRQFMFIVFASVACWAVILSPLLLIF